jgi:hypothetical protein
MVRGHGAAHHARQQLCSRRFPEIPENSPRPYAGIALDAWTPVMMKDYVARPHFSLTDRGSRWLIVVYHVGEALRCRMVTRPWWV